MYDVKSEVIDAINSIDDVMMESTIGVYSALSSEYDKLMSFMDYKYDIYQEGEVWDRATGKYSDDGVIMKIIKFIPRLIMGIIDAVTKTFSKGYSNDVVTIGSQAQSIVDKASEEEINQVSQQVSEMTDGKIKVDKKTKKLTLFGVMKAGWSKMALLGTGAKCLTRLRTELTKPNTDYKKFAGELKDIFKGDKKIDEETISIGVDAFSQGLSDVCTGSLGVAAACNELKGILEKKCESEIKKGNKAKAAEIKDLIDQIQQVSIVVSQASFLGRVGFKVVSFLGKNKISKKLEKLVYADDFDEMDDLDRDIKDNLRSAKAKEIQNKKESKLHKKKLKKRKALEAARNAREKANNDLEYDRQDREQDNEAYRQTQQILGRN